LSRWPPPRGTRGYSRSVRAYGYGLGAIDEGKTPIVVAQIESVRAVAASAEIAAVDGVDVLFVGPADLQFDLRQRNREDDFGACLKTVVSAAAAAGKPAGLLLRDASAFAEHRAMGFAFIAIDSDIGILRQGYRGILQACGMA